MYENIRPGVDKTKRDRRLKIWLAVGVLLLGIISIPVIYSINYQQQFKQFQNSLAESTDSIRHRGRISLSSGDDLFLLKTDGGYSNFVLLLAASGPGRVGEAPERQPDATLSFGNGAALALWSVPMKSGAEYAMYLHYTYPDGETYSYICDTVSLGRALNIMLIDAKRLGGSINSGS